MTETTLGWPERRKGWELAAALVRTSPVGEWLGMYGDEPNFATSDALGELGLCARDDPRVAVACGFYLARWVRVLAGVVVKATSGAEGDDLEAELRESIIEADRPPATSPDG